MTTPPFPASFPERLGRAKQPEWQDMLTWGRGVGRVWIFDVAREAMGSLTQGALNCRVPRSLARPGLGACSGRLAIGACGATAGKLESWAPDGGNGAIQARSRSGCLAL